MASDVPQIAVGTHSFRQRYLFAFATQGEVLNHMRTQALEEERKRLPEILEAWQKIQARIEQLVASEAGLADSATISNIPDEYQSKVEDFAGDALFQKTFSAIPISFQLVKIDELVAPQRTVNLDYVDRLTAKYRDNLTVDHLLDICASPKREMEPIQHLEIVQNTHVFSSPNSDIRFLGSFVKPLTPDDLIFAELGGLPAAAVIAFVGYGGAPVNVLKAGQRLVLNNGFHRVYSLRSLGVTEIPVVVQNIRNPELEFPPTVAGLPKEYLLKVPRPVMVKDFFEADFAITLRVRERMKMVTVGVSLGQHEVPS